MLRLFALFLSLLIYNYSEYANAQSILTDNYVVTQWGMEQGLPQSSVNDIIQTRDGYIWLATFGGLVRFDGISFTTFNRSNTPKMRSDRILHLYEDRHGAIWISTEDGFHRFKNGVMTPYLFEINSLIISPSKVAEDGQGNLWVVVSGIPYLFNGKEFNVATILYDEKSVPAALDDPRGTWLVWDKQVYRTYGTYVVEILNLGNELNYSLLDFIEYPKNSGIYFLGSMDEGVIRYQDGDINFYTVDVGLASRFTWNFYKDRKDNLWVLSHDGVSIWDGKQFIGVHIIGNAHSTQIKSILHDREGNYWLGTSTAGLFRMRPASITTLDATDGLDNEVMLSLTTLRDGTKVFATNCGGLFEKRGERIYASKINENLPNLCVWSVYEDSKGRIWTGSRVLYRTYSLDEPGERLGAELGYFGSEVFTITEDSKGRIWIGAFNGIFIYEDGMFTHISVRDGLSNNDTRYFYEDHEGVMWIGTSIGLNRIKDGVVSQVRLISKNGNPTQSQEPYVRAIYQDEDGIMWFGTYGYGIFRMQDGEITNITAADGLFDNIVSHIVEDEQGYFWMGSNRGISRVKRADLNDSANGNLSLINVQSFGTSDGMKSAETNGGFQPNVIKDSDGFLYFPTVSGIAVVNTRIAAEEAEPPPVFIEQLRTGGELRPLTGSVTLPWDAAFLEIQYTALNYRNPEKIQFRYKMEGLDYDWFHVGTHRSAIYSKIPPGSYNFTVSASTGNNVWHDTGAAMMVTVVPPFWQTYWFYGIAVLLLLSVGPTIYFYKVRNLKKENEQQKRFTEKLIDSQETERRRIASELHDGLGQQILVIKSRAELAQKEMDNKDALLLQLNQIMESAVSSIDNVRNVSHGLRPVHLEKFGLTEALETLFRELQQTTSINWSFQIEDIDNLVPKDKEINFYRVIQEGCTNIIKHSGATDAFIYTKRFEEHFKTILSDNGKGFDTMKLNGVAGLGLPGIKERIQSLGGSFTIESDSDNGTVLTITIPIQQT